MEDEDEDGKANLITEEEQLLPGEIRIVSTSGRVQVTMQSAVKAEPDTFRGRRFPGGIPGATRPPGRSPGSRRVVLPLGLRVPGEGLPPWTVPGVERFPQEAAGVADGHRDAWRKPPVPSTTATRH